MSTARFWLFGGETYYPQGGLYDLIGVYESAAAALAEVARRQKAWAAWMEASHEARGKEVPDPGRPLNWWHIFDALNRTVVGHGDRDAHWWPEDGWFQKQIDEAFSGGTER